MIFCYLTEFYCAKNFQAMGFIYLFPKFPDFMLYI